MRVSRLCLAVLALVGGKSSVATSPDYGIVVGIDLGTTYSCVAIYRGGRLDVITNDQGNRVTPSWVGFNGAERFIGDTAKQAFHTIPSQTIFDVKRLIGRNFDETSLREDIRHWPFKVVEKDGRPAVEVDFQGATKIFTPQEISAMILGRLKETAEAYLGRPVTHAVITVPAYFNDEQRQATKEAGQIAGLTVLRILNEPTAAAIAYGLDKNGMAESKMVVYDLGGGTFDVSLLRVANGIFEVLATAGNTRLGGEDFDNRIIDHLVEKYQRWTTINVSNNKRAMSKLKREVEKAKRTLSSQVTTRIDIESFESGNDFAFILTRAKFEELNLDLFKQTLEPVTQVLRDASLEPKDIDDVILVGGSTRIPFIRQLLKDFFGGREPRMGINPDEAVAYGAAIQGSVLSRVTPFNDDIVLIDVCPFTLGVKTSGGVSSQLILRNTPIPVRKSEIFSTATNNQRTVLIQVLQGDSRLAKNNVVLGTFKLTGIPPAARGVPQIEVIFEVDANGILTVIAHDKDSGNLESITITSERNQLATADIARMATEAQTFSQNDREAHARSVALNELQQHIATKRSYLDSGNKDLSIHGLLDEYSHWADTAGASAGLVELNRRIYQVSNIIVVEHQATAIPEAGAEGAGLGSEDLPKDLGSGETGPTERAGMPEICVNADLPVNPLTLRKEL
ncbi:ATPase with role in protein import into the ER [Ceratobasidium sp. UAMH 11750]|nr:ATPase with role in protein import into the ER [Ceratobasidium sp. UAMH 11750]